MRLAEIINSIDVVDIKGKLDIEIMGISYNSKDSCLGCIFVAVEGMRMDGHHFIHEAIDKGACAVVVSNDVDIEGVTIIRVMDTRATLSRLSAIFYGRPSENLDLIGVTGTNGKTTVTYLIKSILEYSKESVGLIGSLGIYIRNEVSQNTHTTPESLELHQILREMLDSGVSTCVMEVSSHSLKLNRTKDCDFRTGIFTNLTHEHLDFHKTMEHYYKVKQKLFLSTKQANILNIDDKYGHRLARELVGTGPDLVAYGLDKGAHVRADEIRLSGWKSSYRLNTPRGTTNIELNLPGKYNIYNSLAAAAYCISRGMPIDLIKRGLESVTSIPGRFEPIWTGGSFNIIIDYAHTPDGFKQLLETVTIAKAGRVVIVFGCVGERDRTKRRMMGQIAAQYSDLCILTADNSRSEETTQIIKEIKQGFTANTQYVEILDRAEAIRYAVLNSKRRDTILITGKGHERRQIIGDRVDYFNEKEIAEGALNELLGKAKCDHITI